eukprot:Em0004g551a
MTLMGRADHKRSKMPNWDERGSILDPVFSAADMAPDAKGIPMSLDRELPSSIGEASAVGIGAVLEQEGHVVAYASRSLTLYQKGAISCFDGGCIISSSKKFNASVDWLGLMTVASSGYPMQHVSILAAWNSSQQDTAGWTSGSSAISGHCRVDQWIQCYIRTLQGGPVDPVLYQDTAGWTSGSSAISGHCRVDQWIQCYNRTLQGGPVDPVLYQDTTSGSSAISGHCRVDQWIQCYNRTLQGGPVDPVLSTGSTGPPCSVL